MVMKGRLVPCPSKESLLPLQADRGASTPQIFPLRLGGTKKCPKKGNGISCPDAVDQCRRRVNVVKQEHGNNAYGRKGNLRCAECRKRNSKVGDNIAEHYNLICSALISRFRSLARFAKSEIKLNHV